MIGSAATLGTDAMRVAIGGVSAGGGMAAGVALMNRDRIVHPLRLSLLLYRKIDNLLATDSGEYESYPIWTQGTSFRA